MPDTKATRRWFHGCERRGLLGFGVSTLFFEVEGDEACPLTFSGTTDELVAFLSFGFAARYGAQHPLTSLALLLRGEYKIDLAPLLTFADRDVEVEADARELQRAWQDAAPLTSTIDAVVSAMSSADARVEELASGTPELLPRLRELGAMAGWAAEQGARVRLTFEL
jgi:hypothetical protein